MSADFFDDIDAQLDLQKAVDTLSPADQHLIHLLFAYGHTNEEAARRLGWDLRTVEGHRAAAIKKIKAYLGE